MLTCGGLFDGVGFLAYGLCRAGIEHRWLCERDEWRRSLLRKRWPGIPVFDDVRAVGAGAAERVDLIAGGFPCKGASTVGLRNGFDHPETVLWREMRRAIGELRPRYVLVENVANLLALHDGAVWGEVLGDLATLRYDTVWDCLPAAAVGAPHLRDRVFAIATHAESVAAGEQADEAHAIAGGGQARPLTAGRGGLATPDAHGHAVLQQPESERRRGRAALAGGPRAPAADPDGSGLPEQPLGNGADAPGGIDLQAGDDAERRGVGVEWGQYEPAIRRWEAVVGSAPEPLVRRVDDRSTARVDRSRVSAVGDGVQVQVGELVGRYIAERERCRMTRVAAFQQIQSSKGEN